MNDIQRKKQTRYYYQFDVDRSGTVTWQDFEDAAKNIAAWREYEPDSEIHGLMLQLIKAYWSNIARHADDDQDGEVTLKEWLAWRGHLLTLSSDELYAETGKLMVSMFTLIDEDGDGFLTLDEYIQLGTSFNNEASVLASSFRHMDADGDSLLTPADHQKAAIAFLRSEDANDSAAHFVGSLDGIGSGRAFRAPSLNGTSTLLQRKIDRFFNLLDKNGNGSLDQNDLIEVGNNVAAISGATPNSAEHNGIIAEHRAAWASIQRACDADESGEISQDEFSRWAASIAELDKDAFLAETKFLSQFLWDVMDSDKSGEISRHEYMMVATSYRIPPRFAAESFAHLDVDGSGSISRDEYLSAVQQFFQSDDESAVGNWLFGQL